MSLSGKYDDSAYLLYAPLNKRSMLCSEEQINALRSQLNASGRFSDDNLNRLLLDNQLSQDQGFVCSPRDVYAMTLLPNNICNFSCSYCYAAKGHGSDEMSEQTLKTVLDFFVDQDRISRRDLHISFGGGGEPLLSWDRMLHAMRYATERADKHGFKVHFSFASNGSVISSEIINELKRYNVKTNISFDILEDVQNRQRRNYKRVCQTLDMLLDNDILPTINSVITPLNVSRQCEMVEQVHRRFPKLRRLTFDYVVDGQLFSTPEELRSFLRDYTTHFYQARDLGFSYGTIDVSSIKHHNLGMIKSRACAGGFDVNAHGDISMCFFVSSPQETLYDDFIYGHVRDGRVEYDEQKFKALIDYSSNSRDDCHDCFLRWNCGGGCLFHEKSYSREMLDEMCRFQREFSLIALLKQFDDE